MWTIYYTSWNWLQRTCDQHTRVVIALDPRRDPADPVVLASSTGPRDAVAQESSERQTIHSKKLSASSYQLKNSIFINLNKNTHHRKSTVDRIFY